MKFYKNKGEWEIGVWRRHGGGCLMDFTHFLPNEEAEKGNICRILWCLRGDTFHTHKKVKK